MQEHKRERNSIEARLNALTKRAAHHDEHIMIIDAWFSDVSTLQPILGYEKLTYPAP